MAFRPLFIFLLFASTFSVCAGQTGGKKQTNPPDSVYTWRTATQDGIGKYYMQREIAHVMGAAGSDWLERNDRQKEENSDLAIEKIIIPLNAVVADIGAGTGYYSFKLAAKVPKGRVYAVDIQDEMIQYLSNRKAKLKDSIVEIVKGSAVSPNLPANSLDLALMVDVYHELEFPHEMLQAISRSLKAGGRILLIEYRGEDPAVRIKPLHKTTVAQLNKELNANGFLLDFDGEFLPIQHFLLYRKK